MIPSNEPAQTGSAYMTLCVTFERYLVVCWPLRARHLCTVGRAKLAVVVFCLFGLPFLSHTFLRCMQALIPQLPEHAHGDPRCGSSSVLALDSVGLLGCVFSSTPALDSLVLPGCVLSSAPALDPFVLPGCVLAINVFSSVSLQSFICGSV